MPGEERCEFVLGSDQCGLRWGHDGVHQLATYSDPRDQRIAALEAAVAKAEGERDFHQAHATQCLSELVVRVEQLTTLEAQLAEARRLREQALADLHGCQDGALVRDLRTQLTARDVAGAGLYEDALDVVMSAVVTIDEAEAMHHTDPEIREAARATVKRRLNAAVSRLDKTLATAPAAWRK